MDALVAFDDLGDIRLGYQAEELAKMFFEFVRDHPTLHSQMRDFQMRERHDFMSAVERTASGEHQLEWSAAHRRFVELIERVMVEFVQKSGCNDQEFVSGMEECKDAGSEWWTPFSMILNITDYVEFAALLQDNRCLCCGEAFKPYQPEELLTQFLGFAREHPHMHKELRTFQLEERRKFIFVDEQTCQGEHRLEWSGVHRRFVEMVEQRVKEFLTGTGCTEPEFMDAMITCMRKDSAKWPPFAALLDVTDYENFATMLQDNKCLCCGEGFSGYQPEELARAFVEYLKARPAIHKEVRSFQLNERSRFLHAEEQASVGEHRLEWSDVHRRFLGIIEVHINDFMIEAHCNEEEFMNALRAASGSSSPVIASFTALLCLTNYESFAKMLQADSCLCCGEPFLPEPPLAS